MIEKLVTATIETLGMSLISCVGAVLLGTPLGILLFCTSNNGILRAPVFNKIIGVIVNILRSIPFLIVFAIIYPLMSVTMGKYSIGWTAMIPPLIISAFPFVARLVESSLLMVPKGEIEAIESLGASKFQLICRVLLVESRTSLLVNFIVAFVTILGYTAMSGIVAGGGLGDLALNYAFRHVTNDDTVKTIMIWVSSIIIVVIVNVLQELGLIIARKLDHRK